MNWPSFWSSRSTWRSHRPTSCPTAPLYGEGLGLDSIDILEVALEVSRKYGFQLRSDDERNQQIFQSLRSLAAHVAQNRGAS